MCLAHIQKFGIQIFGFKMHIREKLQGVVVGVDSADIVIVHRVPSSLSFTLHLLCGYSVRSSCDK